METILKEQERVAFALRALYRSYGYLPYKMNKFEPYDLYASNKDFLVGDGVITFNDTDGKLLALKPDVTLSIIRNGNDEGGTQKVFYNENVYRISGETKQFKEIMQSGLECVGNIGIYETFETLYLAASSLDKISHSFVLDVSHVGILSTLFKSLSLGDTFNAKATACLAGKNLHGLRSLCEAYCVADKDAEKLYAVTNAYGPLDSALEKLAPLFESGESETAFKEFSTVCTLLKNTEYADKFRIDFSVVNDMAYYNGIVFQGFVEGIPEGVLSGGRYDNLVKRMGRNSGAIGFAVYLDLLDGFKKTRTAHDVDVLVLYDNETETGTLVKNVQTLVAQGKSVSVQTEKNKLRYRELLDLTGGEK